LNRPTAQIWAAGHVAKWRRQGGWVKT
jgi:hypothetical protein